MLNKGGLVPSKRPKINESVTHKSQSFEVEKEACSVQQQLLYFKDFEWEEIKTLWKESVNFRKAQIEADSTENVSLIIKKWPCYMQPLGHALVRISYFI